MTVPAASRILDIIEAFARERRPMSVSALASATGIPVSSCHGLVKTLEERGYVFEVKSQGGFYLTKLLANQLSAISNYDPLPPWVAPALETIRDRSNETILFAKLVNAAALYIEVFESKQYVRYIVKVGDIRPLYASAAGKALLASLDDKTRMAIIDRIKFTKYTERTISDKQELIAHLQEWTPKGWFISREDYLEEVHAVAVPIVIGGEHYACAIAGPAHRIEENLDEHVKLIKSFGPNLINDKKLSLPR
jgi:IclR family transcriptional regulator, acetate operon repressor